MQTTNVPTPVDNLLAGPIIEEYRELLADHAGPKPGEGEGGTENTGQTFVSSQCGPATPGQTPMSDQCIKTDPFGTSSCCVGDTPPPPKKTQSWIDLPRA
jgi:hypothetical protein